MEQGVSMGKVQIMVDEATGILLATEMANLYGIPYIWGGKDPATGLDCSGAVALCFERLGLVPKGWGHTHNADAIRDYCVPICKAEARPGDVLCFGSPLRINHVMMCVGEGVCMGAQGGGPKCLTREIAERIGACVKRQPDYYRHDLVEYVRPPRA